MFIFIYSFFRGISVSSADGLALLALMNYFSIFSIYFLNDAFIFGGSIIAIFKRTSQVFDLDERKEIDDFSLELKKEGLRIKISVANLTWGFFLLKDGKVDLDSEGDTNLIDISLKVGEGEFVAIIGSVGAGKTTLLSTIMNELKVLRGTVKVYGKIAYVEQEPFIINGTVRDNIQFGMGADEERMQEVIRVCSLQSDLHQLANGMDTEIGERGINLSGGQKARISLARACFS